MDMMESLHANRIWT